MPSNGFKLNPDFERLISAKQEYLAGLSRIAQPAADNAKSLAPVDTGAYRDSIHVRKMTGGVRIEADDFKAKWIEYGSIHNPVLAPLRRGVITAGLSFRRPRK